MRYLRHITLAILLVSAASFVVMAVLLNQSLDEYEANQDRRMEELKRSLEKRASLVEKWSESNQIYLNDMRQVYEKVEALEDELDAK